ncbi:MAG: O-acetyl-ADP-ribose deacetylase [Chloroflexi bacterium]|nr:O-acetyl-ADP-ribose deacetylase [Chloroflexota bacterium]
MKNKILRLELGDITESAADAIVNTANSALAGGGGVDGAIHRAGGPSIMEECRKIGGCPTGSAVITGGGSLYAKHVIHTVGPVWRGGGKNEAELLASSYRNSLKLASKHNLRSVAFPSISTGAYGYPLEEAAAVAMKAVISHLSENELPEEVTFVLFGEKAFNAYEKVLKGMNL